VLFHHAQGLTSGCRAFASELQSAGHVVHLPDLMDGKTFATLDEGMAYVRELSFDAIIERGERAVADLPNELVYAGMSLGLMPAQKLAQTRPGARGALLLHGCLPPSEFGGWPGGVSAQIHTMDADEYGDVDVAREFAASVADVELFEYAGDRHLFTDRSLDDYDEAAATQVRDRALAFLSGIA
jgi:dienelactone hydrolase